MALQQIGYQRNLNAEGILAMNSTVVIGNLNAGPPEVLHQVRHRRACSGAPKRDHYLRDPRKIRGIAQAYCFRRSRCRTRLGASLQCSPEDRQIWKWPRVILTLDRSLLGLQSQRLSDFMGYQGSASLKPDLDMGRTGLKVKANLRTKVLDLSSVVD